MLPADEVGLSEQSLAEQPARLFKQLSAGDFPPSKLAALAALVRGWTI
jgi:hypothetical protein